MLQAEIVGPHTQSLALRRCSMWCVSLSVLTVQSRVH